MCSLLCTVLCALYVLYCVCVCVCVCVLAFGIAWKDLEDMVKGIRAHKEDEAEYINKCLAEIKDELKVSTFTGIGRQLKFVGMVLIFT